jgi:hypothetical protein
MILYYFYTYIFDFVLHFFCFYCCVGWLLCCRLWAWNGLTLNTYILMYARTNRCYNELGSRTNYVRSSIPHCIFLRILEDTASRDVSNENYILQCNRYLYRVFVNFYIFFSTRKI